MIRHMISCLVICVTADRWGAGRGDGPCMLASRDPDGWRVIVSCYCRAYDGNASYNASLSLNQRLKVLL